MELDLTTQELNALYSVIELDRRCNKLHLPFSIREQLWNVLSKIELKVKNKIDSYEEIKPLLDNGAKVTGMSSYINSDVCTVQFKYFPDSIGFERKVTIKDFKLIIDNE